MAKINVVKTPDKTGNGYTEVTSVAREVQPLKYNEKKLREYESEDARQRDRYSALDVAKEDAWIPNKDEEAVEVSTEYKKDVADRSASYVNRSTHPKKTVKLFIALRLVRKSAKYHGAMKLSDLIVLAQRVLDKYEDLKTAAAGATIESITKHSEIKSYVEEILSKYIADKKTLKSASSSNTESSGHGSEGNHSSEESHVEPSQPSVETAEQKLAKEYTESVSVDGTNYKIKPADKAKFESGIEVDAWSGSGTTLSKIKKSNTPS